MGKKFIDALRDPAWQGIGVIFAVILSGLPLIFSSTTTIFVGILVVIFSGIFIYAQQNDVSFETFYSILQITLGFIFGGAFIVLGKMVIGLLGIILLTIILTAVLARLTAQENLKNYRILIFSVIVGCVVLISFILNDSISKEHLPILLS